MVDLKWTNAYNASAAPYTLPDPIKEWYSRPMSNSSVQWSSTDLKNIFSHTSTPANGSSASAPSSSASPTAAPSSSGDHAGAIAGGVVGGLAALAIIGAGAFFFLRRRRRGDPRYNGHELPGEFSGGPADPKKVPYGAAPGYGQQQQQRAGYYAPVDNKQVPGQAQGGYMSEMSNDGQRSELDPASAVPGSAVTSELASPHPGLGGQGQGRNETYELDAR